MSELLPGYVCDTEYAKLLKKKTGYGTRQTLYRWRRLGIGPNGSGSAGPSCIPWIKSSSRRNENGRTG